MSQKVNLQQLQNKSLDEIAKFKAAGETRRKELEALKAKGGKSWTTELQDEFDELAMFLVDVDELIESKQAEEAAKAPAKKSNYEVRKGTEKMVRLSIVRGRRFNPLTGAEESKPFNQMFTFSEWQLFKKNFKSLGYTIMEVLHDPYGDAAELAVKTK